MCYTFHSLGPPLPSQLVCLFCWRLKVMWNINKIFKSRNYPQISYLLSYSYYPIPTFFGLPFFSPIAHIVSLLQQVTSFLHLWFTLPLFLLCKRVGMSAFSHTLSFYTGRDHAVHTLLHFVSSLTTCSGSHSVSLHRDPPHPFLFLFLFLWVWSSSLCGFTIDYTTTLLWMDTWVVFNIS